MLKIKINKYLYTTILLTVLTLLVKLVTTYSLIANDLIDYLKDGQVISPNVSLDQLSYPCNTDEAKEYQNNTLEEELNNLGIMNFLFNKGIIENTGDRALGNYYPTNLKNKGPYYSGFTEEENLAKVFAICTGRHTDEYDPVITPSENPIAHWTFDGNILDSIGTNNGIMPSETNNQPIPTNGVKNLADTSYIFDGNDFVNINVDGLPIGNSDRTVCSWLKTNTNSGYHWVFGYGSSDRSRSGIGKSFALGQNSNHLGVTGYGMDIWINDSVRIGQWQHLCASYDGTTGNVYLDGELKNSRAIDWDTGKSDAFIGRQVPVIEYFNGAIDNIRIYNRALEPQEITDIYNEEKRFQDENFQTFLGNMSDISDSINLYQYFSEEGTFPPNHDSWGTHIGTLIDEYLSIKIPTMSRFNEYDWVGRSVIRFGNLSKVIGIQLTTANNNNPNYPDSYPVTYWNIDEFEDDGADFSGYTCGDDFPITHTPYLLLLTPVDNSNLPEELMPLKINGQIEQVGNSYYRYCIPGGLIDQRPVDGVCGPLNGAGRTYDFISRSREEVCSAGTPTGIAGARRSANGFHYWGCLGRYEGVDVQCSTDPNFDTDSTNGVCGYSDGKYYPNITDITEKCSNGEVIDLRTNWSNSTFSWTCVGGNGIDDRCSTAPSPF